MRIDIDNRVFECTEECVVTHKYYESDGVETKYAWRKKLYPTQRITFGGNVVAVECEE